MAAAAEMAMAETAAAEAMAAGWEGREGMQEETAENEC